MQPGRTPRGPNPNAPRRPRRYPLWLMLLVALLIFAAPVIVYAIVILVVALTGGDAPAS